jgi:hypothetical protein
VSSADELVFGTDPDTPLRRALPWFGLVGGVAAVVGVLGGVVGSVTVAVCAAVVVSVCVLLLCIAVTTIGTVIIADGIVDHRRWTGRHVRLPVDAHLHGLLALYLTSLPHSPNRRRLVLRRGTRGPRISLTEPTWSADQLDQMAAAAGADVTDELLEARDWQQRAPGLVAWWERHWILSILAVSVGFWAVVIGVVVVVDLLV